MGHIPTVLPTPLGRTRCVVGIGIARILGSMPARVRIPHRIVSYVNVAVQALRVAGVGRGAYGRVGVSAWARLTSEALTSAALTSGALTFCGWEGAGRLEMGMRRGSRIGVGEMIARPGRGRKSPVHGASFHSPEASAPGVRAGRRPIADFRPLTSGLLRWGRCGEVGNVVEAWE